MKRTLSPEDIWRLAMGMGMMVEQQEREEGVKPGPEDESVILLNALLSLSDVLWEEGGFAVMENMPSPINLKTEQRRGYELPEGRKAWLQAVMDQHKKGKKANQR